jgi:hypothetical protein
MISLQGTQPSSAPGITASEPAFWQQRVALALGASKIKATDALVTGVAKQLARLAATAALADTKNAVVTADFLSDFTQALKACSGK